MAGGNRENIPGKFGLKDDKRSTYIIVVLKKIYCSATIVLFYVDKKIKSITLATVNEIPVS